VDRRCRQTSIDGGTNKQLYRMKMDQTSRRHPRQNLNRNFIEGILLCSEDLQLDLLQIRQNNHICGMTTRLGPQRLSSGLVNIIGLYFALF
jgi:hypothetical protein